MRGAKTDEPGKRATHKLCKFAEHSDFTVRRSREPEKAREVVCEAVRAHGQRWTPKTQRAASEGSQSVKTTQTVSGVFSGVEKENGPQRPIFPVYLAEPETLEPLSQSVPGHPDNACRLLIRTAFL